MSAPPIAAADAGGKAGDEQPDVELNRAFCAMPETIFQIMSTLAAKHKCVK